MTENKEIWVPGEDNLRDYLPQQPDKKIRVKASIVDARYHQKEEKLGVLVRLPDGSTRGTFTSKNDYSIGGRRLDALPKEEADRAMEGLANKFRMARGKHINLEIYEHQA